jgi:hypothetical protein
VKDVETYKLEILRNIFMIRTVGTIMFPKLSEGNFLPFNPEFGFKAADKRVN